MIHVRVLKGMFKGEEFLIPSIPMIPSDMPFQFKRKQLSIRLAFAMTINKSQSQSLSVCGLKPEYYFKFRIGKPTALINGEYISNSIRPQPFQQIF